MILSWSGERKILDHGTASGTSKLGFHNLIPAPGTVRLWTLEAIAHGAEVVSYFRWRQVPFAQEQMHSGLLCSDSTPGSGFYEVHKVVEELAKIDHPPPAKV